MFVGRNTNMKRTLLSLLVVGLFAGLGTAAIAEDVKAGSEPKVNSRAMAPLDTNSTAQQPATTAKQTNPAKEDGAAPAKDFAGNSSDQPKDSKY
jgi:hypothetical protein